MRRTKIVCTIEPASEDPEAVEIMDRIVQKAGSFSVYMEKTRQTIYPKKTITNTMGQAVTSIAATLAPSAILTPTESGHTVPECAQSIIISL